MKTIIALFFILQIPAPSARAGDDSLAVNAAKGLHFVETKPTAEELKAKAEATKPLPKEPLPEEIPDNMTEASDCNNCRAASPSHTATAHAALSKIPVAKIAN